MQEKISELKRRIREYRAIMSCLAVAGWDRNTYMPNGGADARSFQLATLRRIAQEKITDPAIGELLDDLGDYAADLPYDSDDAAFIRVVKIDYDRETQVPPEFTAKVVEHGSKTRQAWVKARIENNFAAVRPHLERTLDYTREYAEFFSYDHIADPLIESSNYGITTAIILDLFERLRPQLLSLFETISAQEEVDNSFLYGAFPKVQQYEFARQAITAFGYDFNRGRLDETAHPFETAFSINDVRITTRGDDGHLGDGIFATMHEAGHALYEQGVNLAYEGLTLARGTSSGVHESQSRLWENRVGRSRNFWVHYYPQLQKIFPQLSEVSLDRFYKAINKVQPSLIRVAADEVTYNLHIMIRSELSIQLLEGKLAIKDLPEAWNARYKSDLGITPPNDSDGVMQDTHWYSGMIGGSFEGYTLGNILGAQYYDAALAAHPEIPAEMERGEFRTLYNWLRENIWQHGRKFDTVELTMRITGGDISVDPLVAYLREKFGEIYGLS